MPLKKQMRIYRRKFRRQTSDNMGRGSEKDQKKEESKRKSHEKEDADARKGKKTLRTTNRTQ